MKIFRAVLALSLLVPSTQSYAAYQYFPVRNRYVYIDNYARTAEVQVSKPAFQVEVLSDSEGAKSEDVRNGRPHIVVQPGETYSVRLYNPLPVRVGVNLTVDGVNSISGKPSGIADGEKWIIDPYATLTIRGWQVNNGEERRFFFTEKKHSYAKWRGKTLDRDLAANCGVIGAAFFWNQQELDSYYAEHPIDRTVRYPTPTMYGSGAAAAAPMGEVDGLNALQNRVRRAYKDAPLASDLSKEKAGTGMGERESNPVVSVDFHYDTGMYDLASAIVIYYDFARPSPLPNPFPELNYAPEM